jgi:HD-like signal output (HDOD) protein
MMHAFVDHAALYLNQIEAHVARLPSLSTTATKVMKTCNDPHSSPNDLNRLIALDPVLAGQVLQLINSAYYSIPQPVSSLSRAIIMLGVNTVKNLVLSLAIIDHFRTAKPFRTLSNATFWSHSVAVGVIAKCIAEIQGVPLADQEDYFVGGLMHDLGKILLNHHFSAEYHQAMAFAKRSHGSMVHAERIIFGIDHGTVGGLIARKWRLSPAFGDVLALHHRLDDILADNAPLVLTVALANLYAQALETDSQEGSLLKDKLATLLMARLEIEANMLERMRHRVLAEIDKAKIFLEASQSESRS